MDMCLDIYEAFKENKVAAAAFIDIEGAFDGIWRNALIYKLYKLGVRGRLLLIIVDFFQSRYSRSFVNSTTTKWILTIIGIPQGSVLSAILFIIYISDMTEGIKYNVRYADDLNVYAIADKITNAATMLESDLKIVTKWCKLWRLNASPSKTSCMALTHKGHQDLVVRLDDKIVKQVAQQRCLGIILDENLKFNAHVQITEGKANAALSKVSIFTNQIRGANTEVMLLLYNGCVLPQLECGYAAWCSANNERLQKVQYKALKKATGAMDKTSCAALEVLTNTFPLDIRYQMVLINSFLQILRKRNSSKLRDKIIRLANDSKFLNPNIITPIHRFLMASRDLLDFDPITIEPHVYETMEEINLPTLESVITEENLGNSKDRTSDQQSRAQEIAKKYIAEAGNDIIAFTDGSATPNPGPCGAGIAIYWKGIDSKSTDIAIPVSSCSTSYHGELQAINCALDTIISKRPINKNKVHIMVDCQSAIITAASNEIPKNFSTLSQDIRRKAKHLNVPIKLYWIAGHAKVKGNEKADQKAKEGANLSKIDNQNNKSKYISLSEAKNRIKMKAIRRWNQKWQRQHSKSLKQTITVGNYKSKHQRKTEVTVNRMILDHNKLKANLHKIMPKAYTSPLCTCGQQEETVNHVLLNCPLYEKDRMEMINTIEVGFIKNKTHQSNRRINTETLLGLNPRLKPEMQQTISKAIDVFLTSTKIEI